MSIVTKKIDTDVPKNVRMYGTELTGNTVIPLALDQSGQITVSLETADTLTAKISGETVIAKVSGQTFTLSSGTIVISQTSGETVLTTVSGNIVTAKISGETVTVASGLSVIPQSGVYVLWASGAAVTTGVSLTLESGSVVMPEAFSLSSGKVSVSSGQVTAKVSGEVVSTASGNEIIWRGVTVSGVVKVSGETITTASGSEIIWRVPITSGSVIVSGTVSVSGNVVTASSGVEIIWRTPIISGSVIVSGNVGISSGIEVVWRATNLSGLQVVADINYSGRINTLIVTDMRDYKVSEGKYFDAYYYVPNAGITSGTVLNILTPATTARLHWIAIVDTDTAGVIELYENTTIATSGSVVATNNRNRNLLTSSTALVFANPNYTSGDGVLLAKRYIGTDKSYTEMGGNMSDGPRILMSGTNYIFKFVPSATPNNVILAMEWYEV